MSIKEITKRAALFALGGMLVLSTGGGVSAFDSVTENLKDMDPVHGFDPAPFIAAASMLPVLNPAAGVDCFQCPNGGNAGGTTAGALTDLMTGEIKDNSNANTGPSGRNPSLQGLSIPSGGNDSGAFVIDVGGGAIFDNLGAGAPAGAILPSTELDGVTALPAVGRAGVRIDFSNRFTFNGDPSSPSGGDGGSSFDQRIAQATFSGGQNGDAVQLVEFGASATIVTGSTGLGDSGFSVGPIVTDQAIAEGAFLFGGGAPGLTPQLVTFDYNVGNFDAVQAPPGVIGGNNNGN